jgi:uncharacterized protein YutE (UPF0331/DUF86 family)
VVKRLVLYKKISNISYNLQRLKEKQYLAEAEFILNADAREVVLLNLQQAVQGCIHIGAQIVSEEGWGVPGSISEIFYKLEERTVIPSALVKSLIPLTGFRNIIVHQYRDVDFKVVYHLYQQRLVFIEEFLRAVQLKFQP